uniref:Uncharacterized protein n=1 Tax=Ditylenchus dipsaci TaxID=166011 RepID=A0A915DP30_9BILA
MARCEVHPGSRSILVARVHPRGSSCSVSVNNIRQYHSQNATNGTSVTTQHHDHRHFGTMTPQRNIDTQANTLRVKLPLGTCPTLPVFPVLPVKKQHYSHTDTRRTHHTENSLPHRLFLALLWHSPSRSTASERRVTEALSTSSFMSFLHPSRGRGLHGWRGSSTNCSKATRRLADFTETREAAAHRRAVVPPPT